MKLSSLLVVHIRMPFKHECLSCKCINIHVGVNHDELVQFAEKHFSSLPTTYDLPKLDPCRYTGCCMTLRDDDMPYAHITMAVEVRATRLAESGVCCLVLTCVWRVSLTEVCSV